MAKAGIDPIPLKLSAGRTFNAKSFHSLRHRFVSELRNLGVSLEVRKELAGHDSDVHRIYTHIPNETRRQAIDALPSLL
jgi:site-specific recombinase XerD